MQQLPPPLPPAGGRARWWAPWLLAVTSMVACTALLVAVFLLAGPAPSPVRPGIGVTTAATVATEPVEAPTTTTAPPPTTGPVTTTVPAVEESPAELDDERMQDLLIDVTGCVPVDGAEALADEESVELSFGCIAPGVSMEAVLTVSPEWAEVLSRAVADDPDGDLFACSLSLMVGPWVIVVLGDDVALVTGTAHDLIDGLDPRVFDGCGGALTGVGGDGEAGGEV